MAKISKKIKILILSWELFPVYAGGLGVLVYSLVNELKKQGAEVTVLLPHAYPKSSLNVVDVEGIVKKYHQKKVFVENLDFDLKTFKTDLSKQLKNTWPQLFSNISKNDKKSKNTDKKIYSDIMPALTQSYAYVVADYLKKNADFDIILGMDWHTIPAFQHLKNKEIQIPFAFYVNATQYDTYLNGSSQSRVSNQIRKIEEHYFKQADAVFSVSYNTEKILLNHFGVDQKKSIVINNDISFEPSTDGVDNWIQAKNVLFMGRFVGQKGLDFLLDTAEKVVAMDPEVKFILAGDGDLTPKLIEDVAKRELERNCIFTGWVEQSVKKKIYRTCQLFVMPSPSEPFGLTALEAIRSDLPVIASENCGFIGVVPSTPTFKYHDTTRFAEQILFYLHNKDEAKKVLDAQKEDLKLHNWSDEVKKVIHFIKTRND